MSCPHSRPSSGRARPGPSLAFRSDLPEHPRNPSIPFPPSRGEGDAPTPRLALLMLCRHWRIDE